MNNQLQEIQSTTSHPAFKINAEIDTQIMTAKAFPRDVNKCLKNIINYIENDQDIADSCIYKVDAGNNKYADGPSIRLAELFVSEWGNIMINTKLIGNDGARVISSGRCWDLEKNVCSEIQVSKSIITKDNTKYGNKMQEVTILAASSIALRNAVFKIIPKTFIDKAFEAAKRVVVNGVQSKPVDFEMRRNKVFDGVKRLGISVETILSYFNKKSIDQIDNEEVQHILAVGTSVKEGLILPQEAFQSHQSRLEQLAESIDD